MGRIGDDRGGRYSGIPETAEAAGADPVTAAATCQSPTSPTSDWRLTACGSRQSRCPVAGVISVTVSRTYWALTRLVLDPASWAAEEVATLGFKKTLVTTRLEVRPPREADRVRFTELFRNDAFMIFSSPALAEEAADRRFDHMLAMCEMISFAKQPIVERASGIVVGYTGVDYFTFEGEERLEWGYRLVPESRGFGYATEASQALLTRAREAFTGELFAIVDPANHSSQNVCRKLGFAFLKQAPVDGDVRNLYTLTIGDTER